MLVPRVIGLIITLNIVKIRASVSCQATHLLIVTEMKTLLDIDTDLKSKIRNARQMRRGADFRP
jgi:hypothetical protein